MGLRRCSPSAGLHCTGAEAYTGLHFTPLTQLLWPPTALLTHPSLLDAQFRATKLKKKKKKRKEKIKNVVDFPFTHSPKKVGFDIFKKKIEEEKKLENGSFSSKTILPLPSFFSSSIISVHNRGYTLKLRRLESQCWACILGEHNTGLCSFSSARGEDKKCPVLPLLVFHFSDIHCRYCVSNHCNLLYIKHPLYRFIVQWFIYNLGGWDKLKR